MFSAKIRPIIGQQPELQLPQEDPALTKETRPRTRKERRGQEIEETAARLFRDRGYVDVSVREIAEAAGITQPTLYRYIGSKQQLLRKIYETGQGADRELVHRVYGLDVTPDEKIRILLRDGMVSRAEHLEEYAVYNREIIQLDPEYLQAQVPIRNEIDNVVRKILDDGIAAGLWPASHATAMRMLFWGSLRNVVAWYKPGGRLSPEQFGDMFADIILGGLLHLSEQDQ